MKILTFESISPFYKKVSKYILVSVSKQTFGIVTSLQTGGFVLLINRFPTLVLGQLLPCIFDGFPSRTHPLQLRKGLLLMSGTKCCVRIGKTAKRMIGGMPKQGHGTCVVIDVVEAVNKSCR